MLASMIMLMSYFSFRVVTIIKTNEHDYLRIDKVYSEEEMKAKELNLMMYKSSMNFVFGFNSIPDNFDVLQNPYFELLGMESVSDKEDRQGLEVRQIFSLTDCSEE